MAKKKKPDCKHCPWADPATGKPRHAPVLATCSTYSTYSTCPTYTIRTTYSTIPPTSPIGVLVGEGPGAEEVEQQKPFVGRTGQWLDERLEKADLDRATLVVLNAQGCQPPKGLKTDITMREATKCCAPLFNEQYKPYEALPTLAMGKWASAACNGGKPITVETGRGFVRDNLLVTWHPTYAAFYNPWKAGEFVNDLQRFKRMLAGTLERPPTVNIKPTVADVVKLATSCKVIAVDIETRALPNRPDYEGKDPYRAGLRTIALGDSNHSIASGGVATPESSRPSLVC